MNESVPGSVKSVFKAWEQRLSSSEVISLIHPFSFLCSHGFINPACLSWRCCFQAWLTIHNFYCIKYTSLSPSVQSSCDCLCATGTLGKQWGWSGVTCLHSVSRYFCYLETCYLSIFTTQVIVLKTPICFHLICWIDCNRFTSDVKIKSISIVGGADGTSPSKMRA